MKIRGTTSKDFYFDKCCDPIQH